jgi:hypothetical protein
VAAAGIYSASLCGGGPRACLVGPDSHKVIREPICKPLICSFCLALHNNTTKFCPFGIE